MPRPALPRRHVLFALGLFLAALLLRLLFWRATPDAAWAYSAAFKGDAPLWLDYAHALRSGGLFENGLPLRPPGMAWLVAACWSGDPAATGSLRLLLCGLGALVPVLFYGAALPRFGYSVAALAGSLMAVSTGLLLLSSSVNNETPYLVLVGLSFLLMERLERRPRLVGLLGWTALQALTCLFRVEHLLLACGAGAWWLWRARRRLRAAAGAPGGAPRLLWAGALIVLAGAAPLAPWHGAVWGRIHRLNTEEQPLLPAVVPGFGRLEALVDSMTWTPAARDARSHLPGFGRRVWGDLAAYHALWRGRTAVQSEDFTILGEMYGYVPRPLAAHPFVALYGPLNFYLATNDSAVGGFSREGLALPPPGNAPGRAAPPHLDDLFPYRDELLPVYPLHLRAINDGYALGLRWIAAHPRRYAGLLKERARLFWEGAALGVTGYNLPYGLSGLMRRVDLVVPNRGAGALAAQLALLLVAAAGVALSRGRRRGALVPWLLLAAARLVPALAFFGYARIGATAIPVVALLGAIAWHRLAGRRLARAVRRPFRLTTPRLAVLLLGVALLVEAARFAAPPALSVRGRAVGPTDPYPAGLYIDQPLYAR